MTLGVLCSTSGYGRGRLTYAVFDLLIADDINLRLQPLRERKARLCADPRRSRGAGLRLVTASSVKGRRFNGPRSSLTSRASSPSIGPVAQVYQSEFTRSVAAAPKGFASAESAMPDNDDINLA